MAAGATVGCFAFGCCGLVAACCRGPITARVFVARRANRGEV